jgi:hypothetical protein
MTVRTGVAVNTGPPAGAGDDGRMRGRHSYDAANFITLMASKSCTPPPTRLVV